MGPNGAPGPIPEGPYTYSLGAWTHKSSTTLAYPLKIKIIHTFQMFSWDPTTTVTQDITPPTSHHTQEKNMA